MRTVLLHLDAILDRLTKAEQLSAKEVGFLVREWGEAMARLERFPDSEAFRVLPAGEKLYLRVSLQRIIDRLPAVQHLLLTHKSDVAKQLFSEKRRFQALNSRYSAAFQGEGTLHRKA
ncbi:MAG: hypothetical protein HQL87_10850 [Magnetococcales bacterium]|nr:hypothetical protein [Magnetococcales bacterium]